MDVPGFTTLIYHGGLGTIKVTNDADALAGGGSIVRVVCGLV
jgi:hypothetical protein